MSVETSWVGHFTQERGPSMNVYREDRSPTESIYRLRAFDLAEDELVPHAALTVRESQEHIASALKEAGKDTLLAQYPGAELEYARIHGVQLRHAIILAHTALSEAAWEGDDFALVGTDELKEEVFKRRLHVTRASIVRIKPGLFDEIMHENALVGKTREALNYAHEGLREERITRAINLPAQKA